MFISIVLLDDGHCCLEREKWANNLLSLASLNFISYSKSAGANRTSLPKLNNDSSLFKLVLLRISIEIAQSKISILTRDCNSGKADGFWLFNHLYLNSLNILNLFLRFSLGA